MEGKEIGRGSGYKLKDLGSLVEGSTLPVGGKEVEVSHKRRIEHLDMKYSTVMMCLCVKFTFKDVV